MDYRYSAIVLKKREAGETDRFYTFYTREAGKIQAIAKGVRKSEAKLASSLETFSEVDLMVVRTRGIGKVAGAVIEESFAALRQDYIHLSNILEVIHVFDGLVDLEERDEILYQKLRWFLQLSDAWIRLGRNDRVALLSEAFLFQLFAHLGYQLELGSCTFSGIKLTPGKRHILSPSAGGVISHEHAQGVRDGLAVSENIIKLLRLFATQSLEKFEKLTVSAHDLGELIRFRKIFFQWIRR